MSQDLLQAAKRAVEAAAQQHDKHETQETEIAYLKARNHLLAVKNSIKDAQLRDKALENAQLKSTLRVTYDREMENKGFQSLGEVADQIVYKLTPKEEAEQLFRGAAE